jgi:hypothetical protein
MQRASYIVLLLALLTVPALAQVQVDVSPAGLIFVFPLGGNQVPAVVSDSGARYGVAVSPWYPPGWVELSTPSVAQPGLYRVEVQYACAPDQGGAVLTVDTRALGSPMHYVSAPAHLSATNGWSGDGAWTEAALTDASGNPILVPLWQGENTVRVQLLANCRLDAMVPGPGAFSLGALRLTREADLPVTGQVIGRAVSASGGNVARAMAIADARMNGSRITIPNVQYPSVMGLAAGGAWWAEADAYGRFSLQLPLGTHTITVARPGAYLASKPVTVAAKQYSATSVGDQALTPTTWSDGLIQAEYPAAIGPGQAVALVVTKDARGGAALEGWEDGDWVEYLVDSDSVQYANVRIVASAVGMPVMRVSCAGHVAQAALAETPGPSSYDEITIEKPIALARGVNRLRLTKVSGAPPRIDAIGLSMTGGEPAGYISGYVYGLGRLPLPNAEITVDTKDGPLVTTSGPDGYYAIVAPTGTYTVSVAATAGLPAWSRDGVSVDAARGRTALDIDLGAASQAVLGDLNGSGAVDVADAVIALRIAVGLQPAGGLLMVGDVAPAGKPDGRISMADVTLILRAAVGLVTL